MLTKSLKTLTLLFVVFNPIFVNAQKIQGNITDSKTGAGIETVLVKVCSANDSTLQKTTITDNLGFYEINDVLTSLNDILSAGTEKLTVSFNGKQLYFTVHSQQEIKTGQLFSVDGRKIGQFRFSALSKLQYNAVFTLPNSANQILLFSDGVHPSVKILFSGVPGQEAQTTFFNANNSTLKSSNVGGNEVKFNIDDDPASDNYKPLEVYKTVDLVNTNYFDFSLTPWEIFYATINFNLEDSQKNKVDGLINMNQLNGDLAYQLNADSNGDAATEQIPIPYFQGNKLVPDSLDFAIEISGTNIITKLDTLRNVTAGELFLNYDNLTLKEQQEFFANLFFNLKDKFGNLQTNTPITVTGIDNAYSFHIQTDKSGNATISEIKIPTENNQATSLDFAVNIPENNYLQLFRDTIWNLGSENRAKNYHNLQPKQQEFFAKLAINLMDKYGNIPPSTTIEGTTLTGEQLFSNVVTDAQGNTITNNFQLPNNNEITAGTTDAIIKVVGNEYLTTFIDTIKNIREGTNNVDLHDLTPVQQEFFTKLGFNITDNENNPQASIPMNVTQLDNSNITNLETNIEGNAETSQIQLPTENELTPGTLDFAIEVPETDNTELFRDTIWNAGEGTINRNYQLTTKQEQEFFANLTFSLRDKFGNIQTNTNMSAEDLNGPNTYNIISDENGTAQISNIKQEVVNGIPQDLEFAIEVNENNYLEMFRDTIRNITEGTTNTNYHNLTPKQQEFFANLYTTVKDSETGDVIPNVLAALYAQGSQDTLKLLTDANGKIDFTNLEIPALNEITAGTQDFGIKLSGEGLENKIENVSSLTEEDRTVVYEMTKKTVEPEDAIAYLWRQFKPDITQTGTKADVIITNLELNYRDTIFALGNNSWWQDTVPVNPTGTTDYEIEYITQVVEGNIPYYPLKKILTLESEKQSIGMDEAKSLEQEQTYVGKAHFGGSEGSVSGIEIIIRNSSNQVVQTITTDGNGNYQMQPLGVDFEGTMEVTIPGSNPNSDKYFGHENIPIVSGGNNIYGPESGAIIIPEKITSFDDAQVNYQIALPKREWTSPKTGEVITIDPAHLKDMEGASYNLSWAMWGEQRMYITPNSDNPDWPGKMETFVEENIGIPYNVIIVDQPFTSAPQITSLDPAYLESIRNQMGVNVEALTGTSGFTTAYTGGSADNLIFNTTADITVRCPEQGQEGSDSDYVIGMREFVGRNGKLSGTNQYISFMNGATPNDLTVTNMTRDFANVAIIYTNMSERVKKKTHTGLNTIKEN